MLRVGQNRIYTYIYTVYMVISQAKNTICTPYIYGSGQPYICGNSVLHIATPVHRLRVCVCVCVCVFVCRCVAYVCVCLCVGAPVLVTLN